MKQTNTDQQNKRNLKNEIRCPPQSPAEVPLHLGVRHLVPVRLPYEEVDVENPGFPHRNPPVRNLHIYILERPQAVVQETLSVPGRYLQYGLTSTLKG
jgi:hypothetical protein